MRSNRILITSPSLNVKDNVSGISSLVADIIQGSSFTVLHFTLGSKDGEKKNLSWVFRQLFMYCKIVHVSLHKRFGVVHLNVGLETFSIIRDALILFVVKRLFRKTVLLHVHGGFYLMHPPDKKIIAYFLDKLFRYSDAVIVLSGKEQRVLEARYGPRKFYVLPNAVNTALAGGPGAAALARGPGVLGGRSGARAGGGPIKLIFIGRIATSKGIYTISESFAHLTDYFDRFSFEIYGAGPELEKWKAALSRHKKLRFTYNGVVGGSEKWRVLHDADIFLLPSIHSEGMPIALIEAMASGCVVIATDDASMGSVVRNNINGILIGKNEPQELAAKLKDIINGRIDTPSISDHAKKYVAEHFSMSSYIKQLDHLYALSCNT